MGKIDPMDHWNTDEAVCPHCGYEHDCSYEFFDGTASEDTVASCARCDMEFDLSRNVSVTYTSRKQAPRPPGQEDA